jgi:hypothetical protein
MFTRQPSKKDLDVLCQVQDRIPKAELQESCVVGRAAIPEFPSKREIGEVKSVKGDGQKEFEISASRELLRNTSARTWRINVGSRYGRHLFGSK